MGGIGRPEGGEGPESEGIFKRRFRNPFEKPEDFRKPGDISQYPIRRPPGPLENVEKSPIVPLENVGGISPIVMTVRLEISMPAVIRLGAQITLEVQISLLPNTSRPPGTGEVKLSIFSPGFRLLSGHVRHVSLSLTKEQSMERFDMEAQEEGRHKIRVSVFFGGTWVDSTTFESQVAANAETEQARSVGSNIQGTPEEGEVTLEVSYDGAQRVYSYELSSATFTEERVLSKTLLRSPEDIIDSYVERLNLHARDQFANPSQAEASMWLSGIGISLWKEFIPDELNQKYWEHRQAIKRLTILSEGSGHLIPWEAMYPISTTGEKEGYLVDQVTLVRQSYAFRFQTTAPFHFSETCFVVSDEDDPPRAKQEVNKLKAMLHGKQSEVTNIDTLLNVLTQAKFNLLHFACHNVIRRDGYPGPYILLGGDRFETDFLANFIGEYRRQSPLVFMNVCRADGGTPGYTRIINWADSFLQTGARAFIGTLWEVRDETASLFAEHFYQALVSGASLGKAMNQARFAVRDKLGDPTWLAYTLYGDPEATLSGESTPSMHNAQNEN